MANTQIQHPFPSTVDEVNNTIQQYAKLMEQINCYSGIIFDMDGTLVNTEIWHHAAWNQIAQQYGIKEPLSSDLLWSYAGLPTINIAIDLCRLYGISANPQEMTSQKVSLYRQNYLHKGEPFPLFCSILKYLSASGKRIALATSSHAFEANVLMEKALLLPYIHSIVSGDMVSKGKPNPDIYLLAAERLNLSPCDCVVFEDTVTGMKGVKNAHMSAVKVFEGNFDCDHVILWNEPWPQRD